MADIFKSFFGDKDAVSNVSGAVSDIFGGIAAGQRAAGYRAEAKGFFEASRIAGDNVELQEAATRLAKTQEERKALNIIGGQFADVAGYGFQNSGTAVDLLADSNRQAALEKAITETQGEIQENVFESQEASYEAQGKAAMAAARAADTTSTGSFIGAAFKGAAAIASFLP